ncbi:MAG: histidine triad nucleotide-binding protein [Actinomycetota bacterium]|nr:histidine triad nucleotide-binding protein [Actinomycetota bacterium]
MPPTDDDCLFCGAAAGTLPVDVVRDEARVLAFRDINAQAPTHVLVIPKEHHADVGALATGDSDLLGELVRTATEVAAQLGLTDTGWRLVFNTGKDGGQTVGHVHGHVLGGRRLGWPPG